MSERQPGFEAYTPSRLEWLVVMLNSYIQYRNDSPNSDVSYTYSLGRDGKTVIMHVRHFTDVDPETVKTFASTGEEFAMNLASAYKWDSWVEIQTQFDRIERQTPKEKSKTSKS